MKKFKLIFFVVISVCSMIILSGCWDYRELNDLLIVAGTAIDKSSEDEIILTIEVFEPNPSGDELIPTYIQVKGETVFDSIRSSINKKGKQLYWGHAKIFFISQDIAKEDIVPVLDLLDRDDEMRPDVLLAITKTPKAYDIFKTKIPDESVSFKTFESLTNMKSTGKYTLMNLHEFTEDLSLEGVSSVIPAITIDKCFNDYKTVVSGVAVFKKNKLVGWLNEDESIIYNIITNNKFTGIIVLKENISDYKKTDTNKKINVSLEVLKTKTKLKPIIKDNSLIINIDVNIRCNIGEIAGNEINFVNERERQLLKEYAEEDMENRINRVIYKAKNIYNSDFFSVSRVIKGKYPKLWSELYPNWDKNFSELNYDVNVTYDIEGSALFNNIIEVK